MSRLALYLLGPPRIELDGVPIKVDTRKAIALLIYLALTGEGQRRATLVNLLWPDYDRTRGRTALRRTLYALNKALVGDWLVADREEIGLHPGADIWLDVDQFHQHLAACETHLHPPAQVCPVCAAHLADAVALVRGEFLTGFGLRDSYNFDDWQLLQAEALRGELADALTRLVQWHAGQREFELAVGYGRRRLALDPLDEGAHRDLMRLYAWSGRRSAALRQYEACVAILEGELGVPPQEATTQLCAAIEEGRAPPLPAPERLPTHRIPPPAFLAEGEPVEQPVFVARERELAQLHGALEAALAGQANVVLVTGEAGQGKTALIQAFIRRAQAAHPDLVAAWGNGNAHTGIGDPYLPFREVLGLLTGDVEARWAAGAMTGEQARRLWHLLSMAVQALVQVGPDLMEVFVPGAQLLKRAAACEGLPAGSVWLTQLENLVARRAPGADHPRVQQSALFEQYTQMLRVLAGHRPLLLALDDLQWADGGSINLLFHLARRMEGSRILIVAAYRPAEVALGRPAMGGRERHPLEPVIHELKRTFGDIEVDLERAESRPFVDAFLDSEPNRLGPAFRETLYQHTRGYPLFTVELLRGMQERGDLVQDQARRWVEGPALDWEILPARVEAVVAERIGRLPERLQDALMVASVEGETFTAEVVARVRAADEAETVRRLSATLDRRHRLVSAIGVLPLGSRRLSRYRFRHILFQRHLYTGLDPVERAHLHQAVGRALESLYGEATEEVAPIEAGAAQLARHFQEAGLTAKAVYYLQQAGERAQRLFANKEAAAHFRRALALLEELPPGELLQDWQPGMAARLYEGLGDVLEWTGEHDEARAAYHRALARMPPGERFWQARLRRKTGNIWRLQRGYEEALQAYDRGESALGPKPAGAVPEWEQEWVQIQLERMWLYYWLGQWREMSDLADQVRSRVERYGTPSQGISFFLCLANMHSRRDRYVVSEETLAFCQTALAISQETENPGEIAWARFVLGFSQLWYGDLDGAEKQMRTALAVAERTGDIVHQSRCLTYLTILHRKRGQPQQVRQAAARSLAAAKAGGMLEYLGTARANQAWVAWHEGDLVQAEEHGQAALDLWHRLPAGHSSCAMQWTALWPLIGVTVARDRTGEAVVYTRTLLDPSQQRLPDALAAVLEDAIGLWEAGSPEQASNRLNEALGRAQEHGYL